MRTDLRDSGESEFAYEEFVKARKSHWMEEARTLGSEIEVPSSERIQLGEDESNFMISAKGPDNLHGVFEDSAETGWFYIYDSLSKCVLKATHVYNRRDVDVESEDVDVCWSTGGMFAALPYGDKFGLFLVSNAKSKCKSR
jgi:hypothetical protein